MKAICRLFTFSFLFLIITVASKAAKPDVLKIHQGSHFMQGSKPFFWLGDTGWELLFQNKDDIQHYLVKRSQQGFTVIQGPVIFEKEEKGWKKNPEGVLPFEITGKSTKLNSSYLNYLDELVNMANENGLHLALTPFRAHEINLFDSTQLATIGIELGQRYLSKKNVLWIAGVEAAGKSDPELVKALCLGLKAGSESKVLVSIHSIEKHASSLGKFALENGKKGLYYFQQERWIDFNMAHSGNSPEFKNYNLISSTYNVTPPKPVVEGEAGYEREIVNPNNSDTSNLVITDYEVRRAAYWAVFSGAAGYTYGHASVSNFLMNNDASGTNNLPNWKEALNSPGAEQMKHLRKLMESRPMLTRVPDQSIILKYRDTSKPYLQDFRAIRDLSNKYYRSSYIMVYFPYAASFDINTSYIDKKYLNTYWFNPSTGKISPMVKKIRNSGSYRAVTPEGSMDWVLIVDGAK